MTGSGKIKKDLYGSLSDGRDIWKYTINDPSGEYVELLDYGATVNGLYIRNRSGQLINCVLQAAGPEALEVNNMAASVIGRCANRIKHGKCTISGKEVQLEVNVRGQFLHGASGNYAHQLFSGEITSDGVVFTLKDMGKGGFDNTVDVRVTYTFSERALTISYEMIPSEDTILCPTNHAYFNLGGLTDIRNSRMYIGASFIAGTDDEGVADGSLIPVSGTPYDFLEERSIGSAMESDSVGYLKRTRGGYDNPYFFGDDPYGLRASLCDPESGIMMKCYSDMQSVILFTPGYCRGRMSGTQEIKTDYAAVCLETQYMPNAVNCPEFRSPVFRAGELLRSTTVYAFENI